MNFKVGDWVEYFNGFQDRRFQITKIEDSKAVFEGKRIPLDYLKRYTPKIQQVEKLLKIFEKDVLSGQVDDMDIEHLAKEINRIYLK